eukprot:g19170.t1
MNSIVAVPAADIVDTAFALMLVPAACADLKGIEGAEEDAEAAWDAFMDGDEAAVVVTSGDTVIHDETVVCQTSTVDESIIVLPADLTDVGAYALLEHGSFVGILLLISKRVANGIDISYAYMFATGAILKASLMHVIPEAFGRFEDSLIDLYKLGIHTAVAVLAGITAGVIIRIVFTANHEIHGHGKAVQEDGSTGATSSTIPDTLRELVQEREDRPLLSVKGLQPICWNVCIGDAVSGMGAQLYLWLHHRGGILSCGSTMGWSIFASTTIHEISSEMADFIALLNGGMSINQIAIILLLGAGSFILIGLTELLPEALSSDRNGKGLVDSTR